MIGLQLENLVFDRVTVDGDPAAIPVCSCRRGPVPVFDWERTRFNTHAAPIAYPRSLTPAVLSKLSVTVTLTAPNVPSQPFLLRAVDPNAGPLGNVAEAAIEPSSLGSPQRLRLEGVRLDSLAVGERTVVWDWEFSIDGGTNWTIFRRSRNRVYVTIDHPAPPWGRPGAQHTIVPWQEPLDQASVWAEGARDAETVRDRIAEALDALAGKRVGDKTVQYHGGGSLCGGRVFSISGLMRIVHGHPHAQNLLSCRDLASAIALFCSVLGCPVRVIRLRPCSPAFGAKITTNPIRLFGNETATVEPFSFHEAAAVPGPPVEARQVWDACLRMDFDPGPPQNFQLSTGLIVDPPGPDVGYRERLLIPGDQNCPIDDADGDGLRYPEAFPEEGPAPAPSDQYMAARRQEFAALLKGRTDSTRPPSPPFRAWLAKTADKNAFGRRIEVGAEPVVVDLTRLDRSATGGIADETLILDAGDRQRAEEVFVTLAAQYSGHFQECALGDFALQDRRFGTVLMLRGSVVSQLHAGAGPDLSAFTAASALDTALAAFYPTPE